VMTERAIERTDIRTASVTRDSSTGRPVVPYSSIIYDPKGDTWVYTSPEPRTFIRHQILVDRIDALKDRVGKVLSVTFNDDVPVEELTIAGIENLTRDGRNYKMTVRGDIDAVLKRVAAHSVQSMTVETYSLEELFLEMYNHAGEGGDA